MLKKAQKESYLPLILREGKSLNTYLLNYSYPVESSLFCMDYIIALA